MANIMRDVNMLDYAEEYNNVTPDDVKAVSNGILRHRISLSFEALADGVKVETIIEAIIASMKTP